jgi:hypothetical protein
MCSLKLTQISRFNEELVHDESEEKNGEFSEYLVVESNHDRR